MKDNLTRKRFGNIAQQVEKVNPDLVITNENGMKAVMYDDLQNIEIHELYLRVKQLEKQVADLKRK
jgi:polyhydroxyalkanoate synthesis regulator phasin